MWIHYYRGPRKHNGVDIVCEPGSRVMAPFAAKILRKSFPYSNNDEAYNDGLFIEGIGEAEGMISHTKYIITKRLTVTHFSKENEFSTPILNQSN